MDARTKKFIEKKKEDWNYYNEVSMADIKKPLTVLLGPNGSGKSQSMRGIQEQLNELGIKFVTYSTSHNDIVHTSWDFDPAKMINAFRSEGERMYASFDEWAASTLVPALLANEEPLWILLDEIDSGLSLDRIRQTISFIRLIISSEYLVKDRDIHFVISCNSFEFFEALESKVTQSIWMLNLREWHPKTYEEFKKPYIQYYDIMFKEDSPNG